MKPNPCNKCGKRPDVGSSYSIIGNIIKGYSFAKCYQCVRCTKITIPEGSVYLAEKAAVIAWNARNPLPETEDEG